MDQFNHFLANSKTIFPKLYLLFSILSLIFSRKMCKLHRKLDNAKIYPLGVQI